MEPIARKKIINRLHRVQGQLRGLENMVLEGRYCSEVLTQSAAVQKSLMGFNELMLSNHLSQHIFTMIRNGKKAEAAEELLRIYRLANPSA